DRFKGRQRYPARLAAQPGVGACLHRPGRHPPLPGPRPGREGPATDAPLAQGGPRLARLRPLPGPDQAPDPGRGAAGQLIEVSALVFDVFGTAVDWRTGIAAVASRHGLPGERFADAWRARYAPSMDLVRRGELEWMNLDGLHRRSLDELLEEFGSGGLGEPERRELVLGLLRLPARPCFRYGRARLHSWIVS